MAVPWLSALASVVVISLVSLVGVFTISLGEVRLRRAIFFLVALAAGALFGDVLIHLIPEIFAKASRPVVPSLLVILGIMMFFVLEKFLHWRHHHREITEGNPPTIQPLGHLSLTADALHNLLDGLVIGASYFAGPQVGLATTVAVFLHEVPQEVGDFAVLLQAGFSKGRALLVNLLSASLAIVGTVIALLIGSQATAFNELLLPLAAGSFLYIAGSDLVPELQKIPSLHQSLDQLAGLALGVGLMIILLFIG